MHSINLIKQSVVKKPSRAFFVFHHRKARSLFVGNFTNDTDFFYMVKAKSSALLSVSGVYPVFMALQLISDVTVEKNLIFAPVQTQKEHLYGKTITHKRNLSGSVQKLGKYYA